MENDKKYVNMALLIVTTLIIVITAFIATHVVYNFVLDSTKNKTSETFSDNYENDIQEENILVDEVSYIELQVDNSGKDGLSYTEPLKIDDKEIINELKNIINSAEEITIKSIGGFFESCPIATIYQENEEILTIVACDNFIEMDGEIIGNIIGFSRIQDQSDKVIYRVEKELEKYIEKIYSDNFKQQDNEIQISNNEEIQDTNFNEGTYVYVNKRRNETMVEDDKIPDFLLETYIKFENNKFTIYDNTSIFAYGEYEKLSNGLIRCIISDERNIEFKIVDNNKLEVAKLNSDDSESEFNIRLWMIFEDSNEYIFYDKNDLIGTWNTSHVYQDMGGGEFWKTEQTQQIYSFTFNDNGTFSEKNGAEGIYELENNLIKLSSNSVGIEKMYFIDENTILCILGTEYKIFLTR